MLHPLAARWTRPFEPAGQPCSNGEALLQKHKIKSIVDDTFMMISDDNLMMLRTFMRDYLHSIDKNNKIQATGPASA